MSATCGHQQEFFSVAVFGGYEEVPMVCLDCWSADIEERRAKGWCSQCGAVASVKPRSSCAIVTLTAEGKTEDVPLLCDRCFLSAIRPDRCEICGRFGAYPHEVGEEEGYYDPYWGPQPPEPIFQCLCPSCTPEVPRGED